MVAGEEPSVAREVSLRRAAPTDATGSAPAEPDVTVADATPAVTVADATAADETAPPEAVGDATPPDTGPPAAGRPRRRSRWLPLRRRGAHALRRMPPPRRMAGLAVRAVATWSRRPTGRLVLPGMLLAALVVLTAVAGVYLVPAGAPAGTAQAAGGQPTGQSPVPAPGQGVPGAGLPTDLPTAAPSGDPAVTPTGPPGPGGGTGTTGGRPADALRGWAQQMSSRAGVPEVAMQAYGYAELVLAQTTPSCRLSWTTLAAIGRVESNHGSSNSATLQPDGRALPAIVGLPLDGTGGRARIQDTDDGALDTDPIWDRAVGPMQFIPQTWRSQAVDADNDGVRDPSDVDDAALAAGNYLCANGRDLSTPDGWWQAVASYNRPRAYGEAVFAAANDYGVRSRG